MSAPAMMATHEAHVEEDGVHAVIATATARVWEGRGVARAWYAVRTKQKSESRVVMHLTRKGVHAFLPLIEVVRRCRGHRIAQLEPLFPSYVFVEIEKFCLDSAEFNMVHWTPGVHSILGMDDTPVPVPDEAIEAIRARLRDLGFIRPGPRFSPGSPVRIKNGPLAGLDAVFDGPVPPSRRARVLMMLLGSQRIVEVDAIDLESA